MAELLRLQRCLMCPGITSGHTHIDRIIRSIRENSAGLSRKIQKEYPLLQDPAVGAAVVAVVRRYWSD